MNKFKLLNLILAASLFGAGTLAHAETLAGTASGGINQSRVVCYLFNAGPGDVNITSKTISSEIGGVRTLAFDGCGTSTLAAGVTCGFFANIPAAYSGNSCSVVISPSAANVRGQLEIRDAAGGILNSVQLR